MPLINCVILDKFFMFKLMVTTVPDALQSVRISQHNPHKASSIGPSRK